MRLYRMQITSFPQEAIARVDIDDDARTRTTVLNSSWMPEGWVEYVDEAIEEFGASWAKQSKAEGYKFFWPSTKRTYLTKQAAESKAWAVRHWGGQAIVLEAEVGEFFEVEAAKRNRQRAKDLEKADNLRSKAELLRREAEELENPGRNPDWEF